MGGVDMQPDNIANVIRRNKYRIELLRLITIGLYDT